MLRLKNKYVHFCKGIFNFYKIQTQMEHLLKQEVTLPELYFRTNLILPCWLIKKNRIKRENGCIIHMSVDFPSVFCLLLSGADVMMFKTSKEMVKQ